MKRTKFKKGQIAKYCVGYRRNQALWVYVVITSAGTLHPFHKHCVYHEAQELISGTIRDLCLMDLRAATKKDMKNYAVQCSEELKYLEESLFDFSKRSKKYLSAFSKQIESKK